MKHALLVTLRYDESLIATIRPQFIVQYSKSILFSVSLLMLSMFLLYPLWHIGVAAMIIWACVIACAIGLCVRAFLLYHFSASYLTTQRLIDVDRPHLLHKEVNEYPLSMIQEVRYYSNGLRSLLSGTGTVVVTPSSDRGHIELRNIQKPEAIKELILRTCKRHLEEKLQEEV